MAKFLIQASYNAEGVRGLLKDGGTKRKKAADELLQSVGARVESFYFAFGDHDAYVIVEAPDNLSIAAASLAVTASGLVTTKTSVLLTPEEIDQATRKTPRYTPPGK
ncbi:MAG: GYD domain-containing protein [Vicinamibacteria bacterium]